MIKVGIIGCRDLPDAELLRVLINHPDVELKWVQARNVAGTRLDRLVPGIVGECDLVAVAEGSLDDVDLVYLCGTRAEVALLLSKLAVPDDVRVIDLSGSHNLDHGEDRPWTYGLSEMAPVSITEYEDTDEHVMFTVGKPWPDIRLKIVNRDTGEACPVGTDGEILVQGYSLMGGYYRIGLDDQAIDAEGWLHTGDRGLLDEEGYLRLLGRYKELILRGGENVMPGEIEYALTELDTVSNAKVIGVPSEFFGEEVCACVVCAPGKAFDEDTARAALSARLARYKVPSFFLVYEELPLLSTGKVDIAALKKDAVGRIKTMQK